ncbi:MAG: hypothetical protein R3C26_17965 [Calditrichia bacterium]
MWISVFDSPELSGFVSAQRLGRPRQSRHELWDTTPPAHCSTHDDTLNFSLPGDVGNYVPITTSCAPPIRRIFGVYADAAMAAASPICAICICWTIGCG